MSLQTIFSIILSAMLLVFFRVFEGYAPQSTGTMLAAMAIVIFTFIAYIGVQIYPAFRKITVSSFGYAWETETSHFPAYVLVGVGTLAFSGHLVVSTFGWIVMSAAILLVIADVLGISAAIAKRLELTDEFRATG